MNTTEHLHKLGQSLWLDNISHDLLQSGRLQNYISTYDVTGLTSNPTVYEQAIRDGDFYTESIKHRATVDKSDADLFYELALTDLSQAAALFANVHDRTDGIDGWVSLEVSPLLANKSVETVQEAVDLHARAGYANLLIKIPGTPAGLIAIEECIFRGVPINVTLLFSCRQYLQAANAYMRAIERRIQIGLDPKVASVASVFVSRWDVAVNGKLNDQLRNKLGVAMAQQTYSAYQELMKSERWLNLAQSGAQPQRLLWASTGSKDLSISDTFYVQELATPDTINTMPEKTLLAFGDHGLLGHTMSVDGDNAAEMFATFRSADIDIDALAEQLQIDGVTSFVNSWHAVLEMIAVKRAAGGSNAYAVPQARPTLHLNKSVR